MRVIGGEFRSRVLKSLPGMDVRPTPDRLREALFNVLTSRIHAATFLDAYAGTGAVGIEALSRGAARAGFLEKNRNAAQVIRENLRTLGVEDRATVLQGKAPVLLARHSADIVFLDPPYHLTREYELAMDALARHPAPLVIVQHDVRLKLEQSYGDLQMQRTLRQGDNVLSFFELHSTTTHP